ncbi:MAG: anaerobic C4-dicarboxylate transporter [Alistipes sp.]|nr:anaerobic C4-dicarboxylate transporter [Candidatus Alistipes equi]
MDITILIQLALLLLTIYAGARYGGIALGSMAGIGLLIFVFVFGLQPGTPPTDVIYIILAAVLCAGTLQASGGMVWLLQIAERLLRRHPERITLFAPFCMFFLTVMVGTGHVMYTLMPIIYDIAIRQGIRPERPCAVSSIAAQVGITCSPIAAAVVAFTVISSHNGFSFTIPQVLSVTIPSCMVGLLMASLISLRRGKDLSADKDFQARISTEEGRKYVYGDSATTLHQKVSGRAKCAVYVFFAAILSIIVFAIFPGLLPSFKQLTVVPGVSDTFNGLTAQQLQKAGALVEGFTQYKMVPLKMNLLIQIIMLLASALMIILARVQPKKIISGNVWQSGMSAAVAIFGIAWLTDTFVSNNMAAMKELLGNMVAVYPVSIAIVFFLLSTLLYSQGAVVTAMMPLAYSLGLGGTFLLGILPSVYGYFFIPNYPSDMATINFDRSGTTRIGKYLLNHSFMLPGLVCVATSVTVASILSSIFYA